MKKLFFLFAIMALSFLASAQEGKHKKWDKDVVKIVCDHILSHGEPYVFGGVRYVLPTEENQQIVLYKLGGYSNLEISADSMYASLSLNKHSTAIRRYFGYKRWLRNAHQQDRKKYITDVRNFLSDFAEQKPAQPPRLLEGTDSLTLAYKAWSEKMQKQGIVDQYHTTNFSKEWENGADFYLLWLSHEQNSTPFIYATYSLLEGNTDRLSGNSEYINISLDRDRPILQGTYTSYDLVEKKLTPEVVMKVFGSKHF